MTFRGSREIPSPAVQRTGGLRQLQRTGIALALTKPIGGICLTSTPRRETRFLVIKEEEFADAELIFVMNWVEELKRLVPAGN